MTVEVQSGRGVHGSAVPGGVPGNWRDGLARAVGAVAIALVEVLTISFLFSFEVNVPYWQHPAFWLRQLQLLVIVGAVAWAIMIWPRRSELAELWRAASASAGWALPLAVNLALFAGLVWASIAFTAHAAAAAEPPWSIFRLYCIPLAATALSLFWLFAPLGFWRELVRRQFVEIALALILGAGLLVASGFAQTGWERLAGITLTLSYQLLSLYEPTADVVYETKTLWVRDFGVIIDQSCSGYEGMALVSMFLAIYLWSFRSTLRFPNAFLLFPIGIAAIFVLNVVRIAVLVSIGGHLSPKVAIGGFHSQAGWMAFLAVTLALMALAPRIAFFSSVPRAAPHRRQDTSQIEAMLVPFMALMAGSIIAAASAPYDVWLYGVKIVLAGAALVAFRRWYADAWGRPSAVAVAAGLIVGILWIATDPATTPEKGTDIGAWLAGQTAFLAGVWLAIRAFGSVIVVPIVEELAFRSFLYRWIIARRFEAVGYSQLSWIALVISSGLFGLMHSRPIAGALAGAVFALLMVRSGRLADAIWAHIAANAAIVAWAIAMGQWSLL